MKLKRILAGVAAASVAVSALAVSAFAGSATITGSNWWAEYEVTIDELLEGANPADVESITFTSDTNFVVGYNNTTGDAEVAPDNGYWSQVDVAANTPTALDNICLTSFDKPDGTVCDYALKLCISKDDGLDYTINWEVKVKDPEVGTTDFSHGGITTKEIPVEDPGTVFFNGKEYQLDVVNNPNKVNLLGDAVSDVENAKAVGIRFKVYDFQAGDPEMEVSAIANANTAAGENLFRWSDDEVNGVTVKSGDDPVATITGNGEYIVWVVFDSSIVYDNTFLVSLVGSLDATAPAAIADDDAALPYDIEVLSVGVQEADAEHTDPIPDDESSDNETSEPTPEDPGHEPSDEPTTPGTCDGDPNKDNSSDDNSSDDNNGNTSVDDGGDNNPGTGVALAVVPAVLAAGALATATIVLKKRK